MYPNEYDEFVKLLTDLCISTNRPCNNDLVRVFWDDLKNVPLQGIQRQAAAMRARGQTKFNSNDLKPPIEERGPLMAYDNHAIIERINNHMLRTVWPSMSQLQRLYKRAWVFTRDKAAPRCVAMKIEPDREERMIGGELRVIEYPGHYIRHEDCDLDFTPTRQDLPLQERGENWNEADAARDLLGRKV